MRAVGSRDRHIFAALGLTIDELALPRGRDDHSSFAQKRKSLGWSLPGGESGEKDRRYTLLQSDATWRIT